MLSTYIHLHTYICVCTTYVLRMYYVYTTYVLRMYVCSSIHFLYMLVPVKVCDALVLISSHWVRGEVHPRQVVCSPQGNI